MANNKDLDSLLNYRLPDARRTLKDSHVNLNALAEYCEKNYPVEKDQTRFLGEIKNYAAQALASVAYQVNVMGTGFLELLDKQMANMEDLEASIDDISQAVDIHREKVARRDIGALASSKNISRSQKVIAPAQRERPQKYIRPSWDFTSLDSVGHGPIQEQQGKPLLSSLTAMPSVHTAPISAPVAPKPSNVLIAPPPPRTPAAPDFSNGPPPLLPRPPISNAPAKYIEKVEALFDYTKEKDDELTFAAGSIIYVVKKNDDGWYEGVCDGETGLVPGNYVEVDAPGNM